MSRIVNFTYTDPTITFSVTLLGGMANECVGVRRGGRRIQDFKFKVPELDPCFLDHLAVKCAEL